MLDFDTYYPLDLSIMNPSTNPNQDSLMYGQFDFTSDQDHQYNSSCSSLQTFDPSYINIEDELFGRISDYESSPVSSPAVDFNYLNSNETNNNCNCNCGAYDHSYAYNNVNYYPEPKTEYSSYPTSYCDYLSSPVLLQEDLVPSMFNTQPIIKYEDFTYPVPPVNHQVIPIRTPAKPSDSIRRTEIQKTSYRPWSSLYQDPKAHDWATSKESQRRFAWSQELHDQFVKAYESLGDNATPKKIMIAMRSAGANMEGITRLKVASHFQKYLQKIGKKGNQKKNCLPMFPVFNKDAVNTTHPQPLILVDAKQSQLQTQQKLVQQQINRPPPSA